MGVLVRFMNEPLYPDGVECLLERRDGASIFVESSWDKFRYSSELMDGGVLRLDIELLVGRVFVFRDVKIVGSV